MGKLFPSMRDRLLTKAPGQVAGLLGRVKQPPHIAGPSAFSPIKASKPSESSEK